MRSGGKDVLPSEHAHAADTATKVQHALGKKLVGPGRDRAASERLIRTTVTARTYAEMVDSERLSMQYTSLGKTGLKVSRLCLGCMSYGSSKWRDWVLDDEPRAVFPAGLGGGHQFLRHRRHVFGRRERGGARPRAEGTRRAAREGRHRHQAPQPDGQDAQRTRQRAQARPPRHREQPAPARHGLRGPLPDPPLRPRHADGGNARRAERARGRGQGALPRRVEHGGVGVCQVSLSGGPARLPPVRLACRTTTTSFTARRSGR